MNEKLEELKRELELLNYWIKQDLKVLRINNVKYAHWYQTLAFNWQWRRNIQNALKREGVTP